MEKIADGFFLVEGPVYDAASDSLVFSDVFGGGVFRLGPDRVVTEIVPRRRGVGGIVPHARGGYIISGRNLSWTESSGREGVASPPDGMPTFNDITTDPDGRIYAGSANVNPNDPNHEDTPGFLHMVDLDGSFHTLAGGIGLTNGLATSPDGRTLYHADSRRAVLAYDRNSDGTVANQRVFHVPSDGHADGLAVAEDGSIWVALPGTGSIAVVDPDGTARTRVAVPDDRVTSLCFGGSDLRTLYAVTGSPPVAGDRRGAIYMTRVDVPGLPVAPARVPVS